MFYKFIQGKEERIRVYNPTAVLYLKNTTTVLTFSSVVQDGDQYWLTFTIDQDNFIGAGICQYQLFDGGQLKEYGSCQIVPSLAVDSNQDLRSKYAIIVDAIEKTLSGVASKAQKDISIGDKKIAYYSAAELLSLLDYFKGKLKEEEMGYDTINNEMKILYKFQIR